MSISVAIVEDDSDVRSAVKALIQGTPGFELYGAFESAEAALGRISEPLPKVVLMDIHLPKLSGIECVRQLKARFPGLLMIMFTVSESAADVFPALVAGASGYLLKRTPPAKLLEALEEAVRVGAPLSPAIAQMVVRTFQTQTTAAAKLSEREEVVLRHLAQGWRYKEIASHLGLSVETIHTNVRSLYAKLQVTSRTEAVVKYLGH